MMLAVLPAVGVAQVMVLVGQHLGNKRPDLAEEASWSGVQVSAMYIMTVGVTFLPIPGFYLSWFKNQDNAVSLGDGQHDRTLSFDVCCALHDLR